MDARDAAHGYKPTPDHLAPSLAHVDIWRQQTHLPPAALEWFATVLSADEHAKADRLRDPMKRCESIIARGLLRKVLGLLLQTDPATIELAVGSHGKPYLLRPQWEPPIGFNLSHTDGVVLLAVAQGRDVGVDVERVRAGFDWAPIARQFFPEAEAGDLCCRPPVEGREAFFSLWVLKEAVLKATGQGMAAGMVADSRHLAVIHPDAGAGYVTAVALTGPMPSVRQWVLV